MNDEAEKKSPTIDAAEIKTQGTHEVRGRSDVALGNTVGIWNACNGESVFDACDRSELLNDGVVKFRTAIGMELFGSIEHGTEGNQGHRDFKGCFVARAGEPSETGNFVNKHQDCFVASVRASRKITMVAMPSGQRLVGDA